jgi:hypothetical protein
MLLIDNDVIAAALTTKDCIAVQENAPRLQACEGNGCFSARSSPLPRGPSLCPLNVRAIWQSLGSRVRGNERMWQFLHTLLRGDMVWNDLIER